MNEASLEYSFEHGLSILKILFFGIVNETVIYTVLARAGADRRKYAAQSEGYNISFGWKRKRP